MGKLLKVSQIIGCGEHIGMLCTARYVGGVCCLLHRRCDLEILSEQGLLGRSRACQKSEPSVLLPTVAPQKIDAAPASVLLLLTHH